MNGPNLPHGSSPAATQLSGKWRDRLLAHRARVPACFALILLLGGAFRFVGIDWDQGQHLQPDERFMTMVTSSMRWPSDFGEYLDEARSPLNPRNVGFDFFPYGTLPSTIVKGVALALEQDGYDRIYLVGRALSALFDLGTIVFLCLLALKLFRDSRTALLASFLLSASVLAIQYSHFFTVDSFATFFITGALYWLARVQASGGIWNYALTGLFFGLALASKISVFTFGLVVVLVATYRVWRVWETSRSGRRLAVSAEQALVRVALTLVVAFLAFRFAQPDAFAGPNLLQIAPSERWLRNLDEVRRTVSGEVDFPPGHQWANRTMLWYPWQNTVLWGMGLPLGLAASAGWALAGWRLVRRREWAHLVPFAWVTVLFLHQGTQWVKSIRYILPIYPALALLAAWLLVWLWDGARDWAQELARQQEREQVREGARERKRTRSNMRRAVPGPAQLLARLRAWTPRWAATLLVIVVAGTLLWALAFISIYTRPHSRIQASRWIYDNIPQGKALGNEHWDDALPLRMDGKDPYAQDSGIYRGVEMKWFDEDTPEKLEAALDWLDQADYIVLSSNRVYDSIPRLPMRFPMTMRYYQHLFNGDFGFRRVAEFTSYPQVLGIQFPDQSSEETFTVYDHPRVQIFQKGGDYSRQRVEALLGDIDWAGVVRLTAKQASMAPTALLLPADRRSEYRLAGTWSQLFDPQSFANALPVLTWAFVLQLLGFLAAPYLFVAARNLPDRGYSLAKTLGLLLGGWLVWSLASAQMLPFSGMGILAVLLIVALGGVLLARTHWEEIRLFWRTQKRIVLVVEGVFWSCFTLFLLIRWANPDLWHPTLGGEKPMDFAYLNAVVRSPSFPPYDPWFADGYINYYYFGFVLVGTLVKLTGIVPQVAYNLALPTLFAMTATGAFGVALALAHRENTPVKGRDLRFGLLGVLFVAVIGNLGELKLVLDGFASLSPSSSESRVPGLTYATEVASGFFQNFLANRQPLPFRIEWWYWNPTRVIAHPPAEIGPITEFPWFTFLFGDLHAHAMSLPLTLLVLGLVLAITRSATTRRRGEWLLLSLLALAVGALWPTNTWDFPTYALLVLVALLLRELRISGKRTLSCIWEAGWRWLAVAAFGYALYLPFHTWYGQAYTGLELWQGSRTQIGDYLTIHGFFLFVIGAALLLDFRFGRGHNGVIRLLRLALFNWYRPRRLARLYRALVRGSIAYRLGLGATRLAGALGIALLLLGHVVPGLAVWLLTLMLLLIFRSQADPRWQMALALAAVGLLLTLMVEFVVLRGDVSRMNTVFKFYFQVWVFFGLAASMGAATVWGELRRLPTGLRRVWRWGFVALFGATLLYPLLATVARVNDRFDVSVGPTLDGTAFMEKAAYEAEGQVMQLDWDKRAMEWLESNVSGSPAIAEANTHPTLYGWGNRYATFTGLPAIVGWDWHQRQQRGIVPGGLVEKRIEDVKRLYDTPDAEEAHRMLLRYRADYVIVGQLERLHATAVGIAKFEQASGTLWRLVYTNPQVQIYRVQR